MLTLAVGKPEGSQLRPTIAKVAETIRPSLVVIRPVVDNLPDEELRSRSGLGVIVDPVGIVALPRRLLEQPGGMEVILRDGRKLIPTTLHSDPQTETGFLKLDTDLPLPHANFRNSDALEVGDDALSLDLGFKHEFTVEPGVLSTKRGKPGTAAERWLMDSARSYPSRRDLLFDRQGRLVGIWAKSGAVPGNRVREAADRFRNRK
jgi:S1-C subfamily serine protease